METGKVVNGFIGDAFNIWGAVGAAKQSQEAGDHVAISLTKGAANFAIGEMFYGSIASHYGIGGGLIGSGVQMALQTGMELGTQNMINTATVLGKASEEEKGIGSGSFNMTETGYTMRQRSLNAIRSNGANINSAFGNEARNYWLGL